PGRRGPGPRAEVAEARAAAQALDRIDFRHPHRHEVTPSGQRFAQRPDPRRRDVDHTAVLLPAQPLAKLEGIPAITLLLRPVRLHPYLVGVDHDGAQPYPRDLPP